MPDWYGMHVVCEPVGRLLRMSRIDWNDGLGVATNAFPKSEFIRSTDAYFRPVWSANAPDGTLVFSDMYRGIIQEKAWFPTKLSEGSEKGVKRYLRVKKWGMVEVVRHGRIYRLVPNSRKPGPTPGMLDETPTQLVAHLANPNGWWRDTAQMLIVSRGDSSAVPALLAMAAKHPEPNPRIHALWSLQGLDALPKELVIANLGHAAPRVRRGAVQLAEPSLAAVINFIGQRWNEWDIPVSAAEIAGLRRELAARTDPFTAEELKKIPRQKRSKLLPPSLPSALREWRFLDDGGDLL